MKNSKCINIFKIAFPILLTAMIAAPTSLLAAAKTVCPSGCDHLTIQEAINAANDGDTINVSPNTGGYLEALTVDKPVKIIGKKSLNGPDAWTTGTAGSSSGPVLKFAGYQEMISFQIDNIELKGFELDVQGGALVGGTLMGSTLMGTTMSNLNIQYCTVKMDSGTKGFTVNQSNPVQNTTISYCSFIGPTADADSKWFIIEDNSDSPGDGGFVDGISLTYNTISQASSELQLYRDISNVTYAHNSFNNSNGYIKLSKPAGGAGTVRGINVLFNTFNNSTKPFADEYAVLVSDSITEADANNDWGDNLAIHFNNFTQDFIANASYPIVGFQNSSLYTSEITATHNWWNSTTGPLTFVAANPNPDPRPDVSLNVGLEDLPEDFTRASITGGLVAVAAQGTAVTATDTSINVKLEVQPKASAAAKVFAAKYSASPVSTAITDPLPGNNAYYDLLAYPSSVDNVEIITATFYYPTGYALNMDTPVYWYKRSTNIWTPWATGKRTISTTPVTFNGVTYAGSVRVRADGASTPAINQLTGTPVALRGTAVTSTTTSSTSVSTTSAVSTTTTSVGGSTTTVKPTSTSSVKTTTTTAVPLPKLTISPGSLNYGADKTVQTFTITNTGAGTLIWNINKDGINYAQGADWIFDIAPASGETNKEQDTVTVTISKAGLVPGTYTASIPISSEGGDKTVTVSMEVTQEENPALNLNPRVLYLKDTDTSGTIEIANARTGTLVWTIGAPVYVNDNGIHWISSVNPVAGSAAAEKVAVSIEVNRDKLRGGIYIATIPVTSNGRNRTIGVVMFVARDAQQHPRTNVDPFILFLKKTDVQKTFTISNAGTGTLFWQLGAVKYQQQQQGWITSVSPLSGETTTDVATITLNIDTSVFNSTDRGLFGATIPVLSTGGNRNVFVYVWIPLLQYE